MKNKPLKKITLLCDDPQMSISYTKYFSDNGFDVSKEVSEKEPFPKGSICLVDYATYNKPNAEKIKTLLNETSATLVVCDCPLPQVLEDLAKNPNFRALTRPTSLKKIHQIVDSIQSSADTQIPYNEKFTDAIQTTLKSCVDFYYDPGLQIQNAGLKKESKLDYFVSVLIPLTGPERYGSVLFSLDEYAASLMGKSMLGEEHIEFTHEDLKDITSEICNQFSGLFMEQLAHLGHQVAIGLPKAFLSEKGSFIHPGANDVMAVQFELGHVKDKKTKKTPKGSLEVCLDKMQLNLGGAKNG